MFVYSNDFNDSTALPSPYLWVKECLNTVFGKSWIIKPFPLLRHLQLMPCNTSSTSAKKRKTIYSSSFPVRRAQCAWSSGYSVGFSVFHFMLHHFLITSVISHTFYLFSHSFHAHSYFVGINNCKWAVLCILQIINKNISLSEPFGYQLEIFILVWHKHTATLFGNLD